MENILLFNMLTEYLMTYPRQLAPFTSYPEVEVKALCIDYDMEYENIAD